jgi:hypothetical protein
MAGHMVETGSGLNPNSALGPLSGANRPNPTEPEDAGQKPMPPSMGGGGDNAGSSASPGSLGGDGGIIRGAGVDASKSSGAAASAAQTRAPSDAASTRVKGNSPGGGASTESGGSAAGTVNADGASPRTTQTEVSGSGGDARSLDERSSEGANGTSGAASGNLAAAQLASGAPASPGDTSASAAPRKHSMSTPRRQGKTKVPPLDRLTQQRVKLQRQARAAVRHRPHSAKAERQRLRIARMRLQIEPRRPPIARLRSRTPSAMPLRGSNGRRQEGSRRRLLAAGPGGPLSALRPAPRSRRSLIRCAKKQRRNSRPRRPDLA